MNNRLEFVVIFSVLWWPLAFYVIHRLNKRGAK